jgi:hypothetical protein
MQLRKGAVPPREAGRILAAAISRTPFVALEDRDWDLLEDDSGWLRLLDALTMLLRA